MDDDGDGAADCDDVDCVTAPNCAGPGAKLTRGGCQCSHRGAAGGLPGLPVGLFLALIGLFWWRRRRKAA